MKLLGNLPRLIRMFFISIFRIQSGSAELISTIFAISRLPDANHFQTVFPTKSEKTFTSRENPK
jgi:hypothetical protein